MAAARTPEEEAAKADTPSRFGDFAWGRRTGGRLRRREVIAELFRGARALAKDRGSRLLGLKPRAIRLLVDEIPVPRSSLSDACEAALAGAPAWVLAHSMRTYFWGYLLGRRDNVAVEKEQLFIAALLHDIGLVERDGASCYAIRGAEKADALFRANPYPGAPKDGVDYFQLRVVDAISLHLNVRVKHVRSEADLLRAGAGFDVVADRFDHVDPETRRAVVAKFPRDGFARDLTEVLRDEAAKNPDTRIGLLCRRMGFLKLIADADARFRADPPT